MPQSMFLIRFLRYKSVQTMAVTSILITAVAAFSLIYKLPSGCEGLTFGDIEYYTQLWYNFLHGAPFVQSSYHINYGAGYYDNKYNFINMFAIHATLSQHVIAIFSPLFPEVNGFIAVHLLFILCFSAYFGWKLCSILSANQHEAIFIYSIFLITICAPGLLDNIAFAAMPLGMTIPATIAAIYYLRAERPTPYLAALIFAMLTSEDASMLVFGIGIYVYVCEKKNYIYSIVPILISLSYILGIVLLIQPAARVDMTLTSSSYVYATIQRIFSPDSPISLWTSRWWMEIPDGNFRALKPLFFICLTAFAPALITKTRGNLKNGLCLVALGGSGFWAMNAVWFGVHHLSPLIGLGLCAVITQTATSRIYDNYHNNGFLRLLVIAILASSVTVNAMNSYTSTSISIRAIARDLIETDFSFANTIAAYRNRHAPDCSIDSNSEAVQVIRKIPRTKSLTFLGHPSLGAWAASRNAYWRYPDLYDEADYLLLQKKTYAYIRREAMSDTIQTSDYISSIYDDLVQIRQSHTVEYSGDSVILLRRKTPHNIDAPEHLVGLNFIMRVRP